jgi:hypothetical protein
MFSSPPLLAPAPLLARPLAERIGSRAHKLVFLSG